MSSNLLWITPIFDRTRADVDRVIEISRKLSNRTATAAEKAEYTGNMKGAMNIGDINRIVNNVQLIAEVMDISIDLPTPDDFPRVAWYATLIAAMTTIRSSLAVHATTPQVPAAPLVTYQKWNDIEKILSDVYEILESMFFHYCGYGLYSGCEIGLIE